MGKCAWVIAAVGCLNSCVGGGSVVDEDANASIAADVPQTDIWLVPLQAVLAGDDRPDARNITRRRGYDNQPAFSADGKQIYYTSIRDGRQADVFVYDIAKGISTQITRTPQSEYSPTPRPGGFSTVQVALDGSQRLWLYDLDGAALRAVREDITGVGYHAWLEVDRLAFFIVAEPVRLVLVQSDGDTQIEVATNIGRSLHRLSDGRLGYVRKNSDEDWAVHEYDWRSGVDRRRAASLPGREDLVWLADGSALMASGRSLHRLGPDADRWDLLVEMTAAITGDIGRMAVDPGGRWLALVVTQGGE